MKTRHTRGSFEPGKNKWFQLGMGFLLVISGIVLAVTYRARNWDGKDRFTLIELGEQVVVHSIDPETKAGVRLTLPANLEIETVGGKGRWRTKVLAEIAKKHGTSWAVDSVSDALGVAYTGVWGRLGLWDRWAWWQLSSDVEEWKEINLGETGWVEELPSPDRERLDGISKSWYGKAGELFSSTTISGEHISAVVVNTTDTLGLGEHAARIIEIKGMRVAMVRTESEVIDTCVVEGTDELKKSVSGQWLTDYFGCQWHTAGESANEIIIKLGTGYRKWWRGE